MSEIIGAVLPWEEDLQFALSRIEIVKVNPRQESGQGQYLRSVGITSDGQKVILPNKYHYEDDPDLINAFDEFIKSYGHLPEARPIYNQENINPEDDLWDEVDKQNKCEYQYYWDHIQKKYPEIWQQDTELKLRPLAHDEILTKLMPSELLSGDDTELFTPRVGRIRVSESELSLSGLYKISPTTNNAQTIDGLQLQGVNRLVKTKK